MRLRSLSDYRLHVPPGEPSSPLAVHKNLIELFRPASPLGFSIRWDAPGNVDHVSGSGDVLELCRRLHVRGTLLCLVVRG